MENDDLSYFGKDPGAVKHGNFINYYSFHSAKQRLNSFNPQMFPNENTLKDTSNENKPILLMDIGCNTGELSQEIYEYSKAMYPGREIKMLAIDIDPTLINRAQECNKNSNITFHVCNIMNQSDRSILDTFLKSFGKKVLDITFCFSVTMWIHLNNGDAGLIELLKYLKEVSNTIVIEPQPWNCYRNAQRRLKKSGHSFALYEKLTIRSNVDTFIEQTLTRGTHVKVYESPTSSWKRTIQSYQKKVGL